MFFLGSTPPPTLQTNVLKHSTLSTASSTRTDHWQGRHLGETQWCLEACLFGNLLEATCPEHLISSSGAGTLILRHTTPYFIWQLVGFRLGSQSNICCPSPSLHGEWCRSWSKKSAMWRRHDHREYVSLLAFYVLEEHHMSYVTATAMLRSSSQFHGWKCHFLHPVLQFWLELACNYTIKHWFRMNPKLHENQTETIGNHQESTRKNEKQ